MVYAKKKKIKDDGEIIDIGDDGGEVLHYDNPDFKVFCRRNSLKANELFPGLTIHWHDDLEFIYILDGRVSYRLNGSVVSMKAGEGIMVNSRQIHLIESEDSDCVLDCVIFHPMLLCASKFVEQKYINPIINNQSMPYLLLSDNIKWQAEVLSLIDKVTEYSFEGSRELDIMSALYEICKCIFENTCKKCEENHKIDTGLATVKVMVDFINTKYKEKISLSDICRAGGVGRTTCNNLFCRYVNSTPMDYLRTYRILKSAELLEDTSMNVAEIAYEVGFSGASYYAECFRNRMECNPLEYRKMKREVC